MRSGGESFNPKKYVSKDIDEKDVVQIKEVFDMIDSGGKGHLEPKDIALVLQREGFLATRETVYDIIAEYDDKEQGGIVFEDFMKIMRSRPAEKETRAEVKKVFRKYDRGNKQYIDAEDIKNMAVELRENLDEATLADIMKKADPHSTGKITFDDFYNVMTRQLYYQ